METQTLSTSPRAIAHRTHGHTRGPITRLVSPSDLGEAMKPFVFLDRAIFDGKRPAMRIEDGWHPHSGIATVTVVLEGGIRFRETTGRDGGLRAGGIEWMRAGGGVWHTGTTDGAAAAFQLWVALPPAIENGAAASQYLEPDEVPQVGPARVVLGSYLGVASPIDSPPMTYLHVRLAAGERWTYTPPKDHDVAWVAVHRGTLRASSPITTGEVAVFARSTQPIDFVAEGETEFVLGSAARHPHALVLGSYSVHTSESALARGEAEIRRIGERLAADGTLR